MHVRLVPWRFAFAFLREPRRVVSIAVVVAIGTVALILAKGFIDRTFFVFREDIIRAHYAHVQLQPAEEDGRLDADPRKGAPVRDLLQRTLNSAAPGAVVTGRLAFAGLVSFGERTVGFLGEGVEPAGEAVLATAVRLSAGGPLDEHDPLGISMGEGLARSLGARVGDRVTLLSNVAGGGVNAVEVKVTGLFHTATKAYDDRAMRVPIATAWKLTRTSGVSRLMVLLPRTEDSARVARGLKGAFAGQPVRVAEWVEMADFYNKTVELFGRQFGFVRAVILAIVLLSTFNAMARNVMERRREIGTMMALGVRRAAVARKFVGESLVIGGVGGLAGVVVGGIAAWGISRVGIPMPPPPGTSHGFVGGIDFSVANAASALGAVIVVCVIASLVPAVRAARVDVVEALRAER